MTRGRRRGLAALSGLLLWLSFPQPFALEFQAWTGWVAWVALVPLSWAVWDQRPADGFWMGLLSGFVFHALSLVWLMNVRPMGFAAVPAWLVLSLWCAFFVGLWGAAAAWASRTGAALPALGLAALWVVLEFFREHWLTGFPWNNLGSSQAFNPAILPLAAITGQGGLHLAVALGNLIFFSLLIEPRVLLGLARSASALLVVSLLAWGAQAGRLQDPAGGTGVKVGIIQGGIDQDQAWTKAYREKVMVSYLELSEAAVAAGAKVLIWPESAFPGFFNEDAPEAEQMKALARSSHIDILTGSTLSDGNTYRNAAVWIGPDGNTVARAKRHLVPFGEYIPFRRAIPVLDGAMARLGVTDFEPGVPGPVFLPQGLRTEPLVCYESIFPELARQPPALDLLAVMTEDTWYGRSAGPVWHASQCALRAVENGVWVARSAATGISLFASPQGQILQPIPLDQAGFRVQTVSLGHPTFYRAHGDWLAWLCLLCLAALWGPGLILEIMTNVQKP